MDRKKCLAIIALVLASIMPAMAQQYRKALSPSYYLGVGFNADTNHPLFSGSLRLMFEMGKPTDFLSLNIGAGYRGFFDRRPPYDFIRHATLSDYLFYSRENGETKEVRPVGGQIVIPAELQLRPFSLGEDFYFFLGLGAEYGIRLYQSHRYADYYGSHMLNANSLSFYPMLGVVGVVDDDVSVSMSLYWRHYLMQPMNFRELYDSDKFNAKNYFGFQITCSFEI